MHCMAAFVLVSCVACCSFDELIEFDRICSPEIVFAIQITGLVKIDPRDFRTAAILYGGRSVLLTSGTASHPSCECPGIVKANLFLHLFLQRDYGTVRFNLPTSGVQICVLSLRSHFLPTLAHGWLHVSGAHQSQAFHNRYSISPKLLVSWITKATFVSCTFSCKGITEQCL